MGIPALFRWLSEKYPKIVRNVIENNLPSESEDCFESSSRNPNGSFHNLYLDMNEDRPPPTNHEEMFILIFQYIDRIINLIRPSSLLFMAIDGVAPRAKMNQQRSRRFRASLEATQKEEAEEAVKEAWINNHQNLPETKQASVFDSNCITPGTKFMADLADALRVYISDRLATHPQWKNLTVILSDASVPGEGEHKIMSYIRHQRNLTTHDPNTCHVLYGLDADLIMLALASHEPYFYILREVVSQKSSSIPCGNCGYHGHVSNECTAESNSSGNTVRGKPYILLSIPILREYLFAELNMNSLPFTFSLERAIDDWIFLCFFIGNDFLPHLPSLEIREGAIEQLVSLWKSELPNFGGFITHEGNINLERVQILLNRLGAVEDEIFIKRREEEERKKRNRENRKIAEQNRKTRVTREEVHRQMKDVESFSLTNDHGMVGFVGEKRDAKRVARDKPLVQVQPKPSFSHLNRVTGTSGSFNAPHLPSSITTSPPLPSKAVSSSPSDNSAVNNAIEKLSANKAAAETLRNLLLAAKSNSAFKEPKPAKEISTNIVESEDNLLKRKIEVSKETDLSLATNSESQKNEIVEDAISPPDATPKPNDSEPEDSVRLWEEGWKSRYYNSKFQTPESDKGCQSWKWYYPYHYSPFASDFQSIADFRIVFEEGEPFKPIEQLMGVLPEASKSLIPTVFHDLMRDSASPIIDFYPKTFPLDMDGKKYTWQGIALLPFIDEKRLLSAMTPIYNQLSPEETKRNTTSHEIICVRQGHALYEDLCSSTVINTNKSNGIAGSVTRYDEVVLPGGTYMNLNGECVESMSISAYYILPPKPPVFSCDLLAGIVLPPKVLTADDIYYSKPGYGSFRGRGRGRGSYRGRTDDVYMGGGGYSNFTGGYNHKSNEEDPSYERNTHPGEAGAYSRNSNRYSSDVDRRYSGHSLYGNREERSRDQEDHRRRDSYGRDDRENGSKSRY